MGWGGTKSHPYWLGLKSGSQRVIMKAAVELARAALDFLERHQLEPTGTHYELARRYLATPDSPLARDIGERTDDGLRLTSDDAASLADQYPQDIVYNGADQGRRVPQPADRPCPLDSDTPAMTNTGGDGASTATAPTVSHSGAATDDFASRLSLAEQELVILRGEMTKLLFKFEGRIGGLEKPDRDELTEALDQRGGQRVLDDLAESGRDYLLIMFSLDNIVDINARHTRDVGNNVLSALAGTLRQVFPEQELIRWTGNEFIVVMRDTTHTAARMLTDEALTAMSSRRFKLRGNGEWIGVITASAGIAMGKGEETTAVLDLARANVRLSA